LALGRPPLGWVRGGGDVAKKVLDKAHEEHEPIIHVQDQVLLAGIRPVQRFIP
jgi:hypothetical protein